MGVGFTIGCCLRTAVCELSSRSAFACCGLRTVDCELSSRSAFACCGLRTRPEALEGLRTVDCLFFTAFNPKLEMKNGKWRPDP
jgi:hypothetical protein